MKQIKMGTCIPGTLATKWLPHFIKAGFETISLNFHMSLEGTDLTVLSNEVKEIMGDSGVEDDQLVFIATQFRILRM